MSDLANTNEDLVSFARSSIGYLKSVCLDEFELFYAYFSSGDQEVYTFLESICAPLYDNLRPRIVREMELVKLCELCTLLQTRYMRDLEDPELDPIDKSQMDFGRLVQTVLQETQTRIVTRAQLVVKDEIEFFTPTADDLNYPAKATQAQDEKQVNHEFSDKGKSMGGLVNFETDPIPKAWFPTLTKAIWLLSRIYRLVNPTIFGDLAHQVVHSCTMSLIKASHQFAATKSPVDGQLFLIKHLLILKEQIVAFDIEYLMPNVEAKEIETLSGTFWDVYMKGGLFTRDGILRLVSVGLPKAVENMIDAKVELDVNLRGVITAFTTNLTKKIIPPEVSYIIEPPTTSLPSLPLVILPTTINSPPSQQQTPSRIPSPLPSLPSLSSHLPSIPFLSSAARSAFSRSPSPAPPQSHKSLSPPPSLHPGSFSNIPLRKSSLSPPSVSSNLSSHPHFNNNNSINNPTIILPPPPIPLATLIALSPTSIITHITSTLPYLLPSLRTKLSEYLSDRRTCETLIGAVLESVITKYELFYGRLVEISNVSLEVGAGEEMERKKKAEALVRDMWHPDRFVLWVEEVGRVHGGGGGGGGEGQYQLDGNDGVERGRKRLSEGSDRYGEVGKEEDDNDENEGEGDEQTKGEGQEQKLKIGGNRSYDESDDNEGEE